MIEQSKDAGMSPSEDDGVRLKGIEGIAPSRLRLARQMSCSESNCCHQQTSSWRRSLQRNKKRQLLEVDYDPDLPRRMRAIKWRSVTGGSGRELSGNHQNNLSDRHPDCSCCQLQVATRFHRVACNASKLYAGELFTTLLLKRQYRYIPVT